MVSAPKVKKMIHQSVWVFLVSVIVDYEIKPIVSYVPFVTEFEDIFHEDLPGFPSSGFPSSREVDYGIDLEPNTTTISNTPPYRTSPNELRELKEQI